MVSKIKDCFESLKKTILENYVIKRTIPCVLCNYQKFTK